MTQYSKGQRIQYKARDELIEDGFSVMIAARSLGPFDMIAWDAYSVRWIQVKSCSQKRFYKLNQAELQEIEEAVIPCGYDKEVWIWLKRRGWRKWAYRLINTWQWFLIEGNKTLSKKDLKKFIDQPLLIAKKPF